MRNHLFAAIGLIAALAAAPAQAVGINFSYSGFFGAGDSLTPEGGTASPFAPATPFQLEATFDDAAPNLAAGIAPGFLAQTPLRARMTIDGQTYRVAAFPDDPVGGITIAIFDQTNPFVPGRYGLGFIVDPVTDGAGVIGRFAGATTEFTIGDLQSATMTGFIGAGFRSGPGAPPGACYANPALCSTVPISLTDATGAMFGLTLATRPENVEATGLVHSASIAPVPLPGGLALMLGGMALAGLLRAGRRRAA